MVVDTTLSICCKLQRKVAFLQGDMKFYISCDTAVHCKFAMTSDQSERALRNFFNHSSFKTLLLRKRNKISKAPFHLIAKDAHDLNS